MTIFDEWDVSPSELSAVLTSNPSLRGMLLGYVAELKLKKIIQSFPNVSFITKFDDHNRKKKGDLYIIYKERAFDVESKSLQSSMISYDQTLNMWSGKAQVDASDRRDVVLPNGEILNTTLLLRGEFDILAVNCYAFSNKWDFVFARNNALPCSSYKVYTPYQQQCLIASLIPVTLPPSPPFYSNLQELLDEMVANGEGSDPSAL